MVYFGTLLLMAGAYIAATLPGGIASLRLWATPEGNAVLAGAILILAGLTVAVKRGSA